MPQYLIDVMGILGGAPPAIGIVMLLTAVVKEDIMLLFFLFGFVCVIFLKLNMIALAIVAGVIAYIYFQAKSKPTLKAATDEGSYDDFDDERNSNGTKKSYQLLDKKTLNKSYIRWMMYNLVATSFEFLEAFGFALSMEPIAKKIYKDNPEAQKAMLKDTLFFTIRNHKSVH